MRMLKYSIILAALVAALSCQSASEDPAVAKAATDELTDGEHDLAIIENSWALAYKLSLPKGYARSANKQWPLILFLHGAGERADSLSGDSNELERVAVHGPIKLARTRDLPFVIVAPQCPPGRSWRSDELMALLDLVSSFVRIDSERVIVTGLSMGGYGTWQLGLTHPERFAALVPICGGGDVLTARMLGSAQKNAVRKLGIWAFHGAKDRRVKPEESERMIRLVESIGAKPTLTIYDDLGHNSWDRAYDDPQLWQWLSEQRRR